jgi:hypothetical protein
MNRVNEWLKNNFYCWFAIATALDLLLLGWIAWKMH